MFFLIEGQTSDNMDKSKSRGGQSQIREEKKKDDQRRKKIQVREKVERCQTLCFSNDLWPRGSRSRLAKAAGAEPSGEMRDGKLHGVVAQSTFLDVEMFKSTRSSWCQAHVQVKMSKTKNTTCLGHF